MVDYTDPTNHKRVLWLITQWSRNGTIFSSVDAVIIKPQPPYGHIVWGFSVYRRSPGFRTFGTSIETLMSRCGEGDGCYSRVELFSTRQEARQCFIEIGGHELDFDEQLKLATPPLKWLNKQTSITHDLIDAI